jgi:soluble lytic murein transglycosylase-like protein
MQLMPMTAERLAVHDRCNIDQNISGGVRHLAWLVQRFAGDFRLALAAYYAGEDIVTRRGLNYRNPDVVAYVSRIRTSYLRIAQAQTPISELAEKRDIR